MDDRASPVISTDPLGGPNFPPRENPRLYPVSKNRAAPQEKNHERKNIMNVGSLFVPSIYYDCISNCRRDTKVTLCKDAYAR